MEQWAEMTETLRMAAQRAELWVKEREGLANMLGEAKEAVMFGPGRDERRLKTCLRILMNT